MIDQVLNTLFESQPTQKKKILDFFERTPAAKEELGGFLKYNEKFFNDKNISITDIVKSYTFLCNQMIHSRIHFIKTGSYPTESQDDALLNVYSDINLMTNYLIGLAISQFLWEHHYLVLQFYKKNIRETASSYLEVGAGHGLFLLEYINAQPHCKVYDVVDISKAAIDISKGILDCANIDKPVNLVHSDILSFSPNHLYDFITMGEVLEHLDNPREILIKLRTLLSKSGRFFLSTCVNCPAIDHVFHFKTVQEVRDLLQSCGFKIVLEIEVPSEKVSPQRLEKLKLDISYACILEGV